MAQFIKYKDPLGVVQTVQFDVSYPVEIAVPNDNTEWELVTTSPDGSLTTEHVGNRPKK